MDEQGVRINKYLSEAGVCSRREADRQIEAGASLRQTRDKSAAGADGLLSGEMRKPGGRTHPARVSQAGRNCLHCGKA